MAQKPKKRVNSKAGVSKSSKIVTIRLKVGTYEKIARRAKNWRDTSPAQYLQRRIEYDFNRKHG